ncbi:linear amide C-N hydrolase [Solidesulfovibrio sp. C21]|uniref:linear amide C-N hydrolase n=1 Tax=Solidesulfovibrio sp. C21 TaxID=3398613 RepID=UPI0039FCC893
MKQYLSCLVVVGLSLLLAVPPVSACTSIRIKTTDGKVFYARTMEYAQQLHSGVITIPKDTPMAGILPDGSLGGLKWKSTHGVVGMDAFGKPIVCDGMNDAGLVVGGLLFPGYAGYPSYNKSKAAHTISNFDVVKYILSRFATVAEVRSGMKDVIVCQGPESLDGVTVGPVPMHYTVHDASGASIVIEYQNGQCHIYDNPLGVLTNSPDFPWMRIYLGNFVNLSAVNAKPIDVSGFKVDPTGQGSGMLGLPGDFTPPNRFLRMVALTQAAKPVTGADAGLALVMTIIGNVDIPYGAVRDNGPQGPLFDYTQWTVAADTARGRFYFRTYNDKNWRYVDVKESLAKAGAGITTLPIDIPADYPDVTAQAKAVK